MADEVNLHGPWHIDRGEGTKIKDALGNTVLWTQHTHLKGRRTDEEVMAIAHLAGAAPKLLSSLRAMVDWANAALNCKDWHWDGDQREAAERERDEALAAIARAEGRS